MNPEQELLDTIEQIRATGFPDIPADLVARIVMIERDFTDDRQEAFKRISQVIDESMNKDAVRGKEAM